jgi:hypothetical protein
MLKRLSYTPSPANIASKRVGRFQISFEMGNGAGGELWISSKKYIYLQSLLHHLHYPVYLLNPEHGQAMQVVRILLTLARKRSNR